MELTEFTYTLLFFLGKDTYTMLTLMLMNPNLFF